MVSLFIGPLATALIVVWPRSTAPRPIFHPVRNARDRFLLLATAAMVLVVLGGIMAVFGGIAGADTWFVVVAAVVAGLAVAGFVYTVRGYNRHATAD